MTQPGPRDDRVRVTVVGSGTRFLSGISYYTHRLASALTQECGTSVVLMRRLLPTRFYPGRERVGKSLTSLRYPAQVATYDGVDWFWGLTAVRAVRFLRRQRPHVVVFQWWTGTVLHTYLLLAVIARWLGARVVIEFHEVQDVGELGVPLAGRYVRAVFPHLLALTDGFVVHSDFDRAALEQHYGLGVHRPLSLIPHGPYESFALPAGAAGVPVADGPVRLLYFGVIRPFKGVEDIVAALEAMSPEDVANFHLTVVGETWEGWTVPAQLIAASPLAERITFVNRYVTDEEVGRHFADADVVVLPYHRSSASGPLHVAMSHGLPVVVTSVGGLVEAAAEYGGAVFVPPRDPEALRRGICTAAQLRGRRFPDVHSWQRTTAGYLALFDRLGVRPAARETQ